MWADQTMPELWFYEKSGVEESDNGCCAYVDKKKWYSKDCQRKQDAFVCEFSESLKYRMYLNVFQYLFQYFQNRLRINMTLLSVPCTLTRG